MTRIKAWGIWTALALAMGLSATSLPAGAQQVVEPVDAPADKSAQEAEKIEEITVTASKSSGTRIDRRVYDIRTDPQATTGQLSDVLARVPSVVVTPDDKVYLRGDPGVTIWVDGRPPAEGRQILRILSASEIERIEVITNPSAQFSAATSKGIINIITKKPRGTVKRRGSVSTSLRTRDGYSGNVTFDDGKGPWSWGFGLNANGGDQKNRSVSVRDYVDASGAVTDRFQEESYALSTNLWRSVGLRAGYKLGPRSSVKLRIKQSQAGWTSDRWTRYDSTLDGQTLERSHEPWFMRIWSHEFNYTYADDKGERLTVEVSDELNKNRDRIRYDLSGATTGVREARDIQREHVQEFKSDYEKPLGGSKLLSAGLNWQRQNLHMARGLDTEVAGETGYDSRFAGRETTSSAYVTLQWPLGTWTAMPGLRVEDRRRRIVGRTGGETEWFPSLHLSHPYGDGGKVRLSYSRRLDPISLGQYDPQILYGSVSWAQSGNPDLRLVLVNSLEAGYDWEKKDASFGATVFLREADNAIENVTTLLTGDVVLSRPVNRGRTQYGGFDVNWRFPVKALPGKGKWSQSGSASFNRSRSEALEAGGRRDTTNWMLKPMLQYDGPKRAGLSGDQYQLSATIMKMDGLQSDTDLTWTTDVSWSHPLNKTLTMVVSASNLLRNRVTRTEAITARYRGYGDATNYDQAFRVALNYKFGN